MFKAAPSISCFTASSSISYLPSCSLHPPVSLACHFVSFLAPLDCLPLLPVSILPARSLDFFCRLLSTLLPSRFCCPPSSLTPISCWSLPLSLLVPPPPLARAQVLRACYWRELSPPTLLAAQTFSAKLDFMHHFVPLPGRASRDRNTHTHTHIACSRI